MLVLLANTYFKFLVIPFVTTFLVIFVRSASRSDNQRFFMKEDFAFGLEMSVTAILLLLSNCVNIACKGVSDPDLISSATERLLSLSITASILIFGLWAMSTIVRRIGWEKEISMNCSMFNSSLQNQKNHFREI